MAKVEGSSPFIRSLAVGSMGFEIERSTMRRIVMLAAVALALAPASALAALKSFHTPSGNIGCVGDNLSGTYEFRCDIGQHTWKVTHFTGRKCPLERGDSLGLTGARGKTYWVCHGDTALHQGPVLRYGVSWSFGPFSCVSRITGLTCQNLANHGFFLSRAKYRIF